MARLELHIETANVGADTGGPERESDFRGRKRDRYPLVLFPLFLPSPSSIPVGMKAERIGGMGKEGKDESTEEREGVVAAAVTNIPGMDYGAGP